MNNVTESVHNDTNLHQDGPNDESVVECRDLTKSYGDFTALSDCNLTIRGGDVFGLLGPNGAGKTTLIRTVLGYLHRTSGRCTVMGIDPAEDNVAVRRRVSYLPGEARLPGNMRGYQVLKFFAKLHPAANQARSDRIAKTLELDTRRRVAFMSTGMRQKLALAVVLGIESPILILDEPTANLDPSVRGQVLELIKEANADGRTVIFSSHVLSEIEDTCSRVVFLRAGRLVHQLQMDELAQRHRVWFDRPAQPIEIPESLADSVHRSEGFSGSDQVVLETSGDLQPTLGWLNSMPLSGLRIDRLGLRSVYDSVHTGSLGVSPPNQGASS